MQQFPLTARFCNAGKLAARCALSGMAASLALYGGTYFAMALANYFDGHYKYPAFYTRYPTALAYLRAYGVNGSFESLPGYKLVVHVGIPVALGCGALVLAVLLMLLLRNLSLTISEEGMTGKPLLRRMCFIRPETVVSVKPTLGGLRLRVGKKNLWFPLMRNRQQVLQCICRICPDL